MPAHHAWLIVFSLGILLSGLICICPLYALVGGRTNTTKSEADQPTHQPAP